MAHSLAAAPDDVEPVHLRILVLLSERDSISVSELSRSTRLSVRKLSDILDTMEAAGSLSTYLPGRGIGETVAIAEKGRRLVERVTAWRRKDIDQVLERMSSADRAAVAEAFSSFAAAADEPAVRPVRTGLMP